MSNNRIINSYGLEAGADIHDRFVLMFLHVQAMQGHGDMPCCGAALFRLDDLREAAMLRPSPAGGGSGTWDRLIRLCNAIGAQAYFHDGILATENVGLVLVAMPGATPVHVRHLLETRGFVGSSLRRRDMILHDGDRP